MVPASQVVDSLGAEVVTYCAGSDGQTGGQIWSPDGWNLIARGGAPIGGSTPIPNLLG